MSKLFSGAALCAVLCAGTSAFATQTFNVTYATEDPSSSDTVQITDSAIGVNLNAHPAGQYLTGSFSGSSAVVTLQVLCDDLLHRSVEGDQSESYTLGPVTTDFAGNTLSSTQIGEMGYLALNFESTTDIVQKEGDQEAVWAIEYPGVSLVNSNPAVTTALNSALVQAEEHPINPALVPQYTSTDSHQSYISAAPEPATWAMMLLGVGLIGGTLRLNRRRGLAHA